MSALWRWCIYSLNLLMRTIFSSFRIWLSVFNFISRCTCVCWLSLLVYSYSNVTQFVSQFTTSKFSIWKHKNMNEEWIADRGIRIYSSLHTIYFALEMKVKESPWIIFKSLNFCKKINSSVPPWAEASTWKKYQNNTYIFLPPSQQKDVLLYI